MLPTVNRARSRRVLMETCMSFDTSEQWYAASTCLLSLDDHDCLPDQHISLYMIIDPTERDKINSWPAWLFSQLIIRRAQFYAFILLSETLSSVAGKAIFVGSHADLPTLPPYNGNSGGFMRLQTAMNCNELCPSFHVVSLGLRLQLHSATSVAMSRWIPYLHFQLFHVEWRIVLRPGRRQWMSH